MGDGRMGLARPLVKAKNFARSSELGKSVIQKFRYGFR